MARRDFDFKDDDAILSQGKKPHENRPFTVEDEIQVILKILNSFSKKDACILSAYRICKITKTDIREIAIQHNISTRQIFRLIKRVRNTFQCQTRHS